MQGAVDELARFGGPDAYLSQVVTNLPLMFRTLMLGDGAEAQVVKLPMPTRTRLALEMALHEEQERRALEGELEALERAWREAEEIASIADDLLLPAGVRSRIDHAMDGR